ncbi:hypothetical protein SNE25_12170 [Mucilaginibacter sabulilitoris]|uniref:Bor protein n=1 Tax=Mucilaginibacter sabulilitoris TaxID=1173583 RepID=A0ABZ0TWV0_9SPHI|nr:hypothetical protein [Mucilaginibacter sabulilitoris]WPU96274.1 hypothetical protein SNE25_12170 [Mucilaginibacter sabulilitoris]
MMLLYSRLKGHCRKLLLASAITLTLNSCYTTRVATQAQPGSEVSSRTVNSFFWGIIQSPKRVNTPICDSLNVNGLAEVTVRNNFGYSLITVITLGIWSPTRVEWKCGKPCQKVGTL